jgi:F-type H+-transporting ATPase subunit gamma
MIPKVIPHIKVNNHVNGGTYLGNRGVLIIVGSERGLCGNFNRLLVKHAAERLKVLESQAQSVELHVFGSAVWRAIHREYASSWKGSLHSMPSVPSSKMAGEWSATWLNDFDQGDVDWVEIICNQNSGTAAYKTMNIQIIPFQLPDLEEKEHSWPGPILDTDPKELTILIIRQLAALDFYRILLYSSIAEHKARYQLMEEASSNADQLIEELSQDVQAARRQAITQEMEELAVGAGLL